MYFDYQKHQIFFIIFFILHKSQNLLDPHFLFLFKIKKKLFSFHHTFFLHLSVTLETPLEKKKIVFFKIQFSLNYRLLNTYKQSK